VNVSLHKRGKSSVGMNQLKGENLEEIARFVSANGIVRHVGTVLHKCTCLKAKILLILFLEAVHTKIWTVPFSVQAYADSRVFGHENLLIHN
jgi:hypothetical protein